MHSRHTPLNYRQHAALRTYAQFRVIPYLSDPAAWLGLSFALRRSAANGVFDVLKQVKPTRRATPHLPSAPSAPDLETRLFALFAE